MLELLNETPVQKINYPVFDEHKVEAFIKRDDLIHPFISGNKWRKLKYVLADAKNQHKNHLVSFGGAYSNHLVALACAGAMYGFKTTAFVRGEEVHNHMLLLCKIWGMQLYFVSREAYKNKHELFNSYFANDSDSYFIDEGGRGELAMKGCAEILDGCTQKFSHTICAVGTGTTLAGLAIAGSKQNILAEGICVLKGAEEIYNDVKILIPNLDNWKIHHQFYRGGYAKTDEELLQFIKTFASSTGILLDQVYTAKMMMGVIQLVNENYYPPHSKLLLIHTGGLLGLLSQ
jgi:1-aminocyclopropane-1-carboxylate deaminase